MTPSLPIQTNIPLWNAKLDGFGRNPQGKNRQDGVSPWHAFHAGRDFKADAKPAAVLLAKLAEDVAAFMNELKLRAESKT